MSPKDNRSFVAISYAKKMDYLTNYVVLPKNYGSKKYFEREDIQAINELVTGNLNTLNTKSNFTEKIANKRVIIKPNLVGIFKNLGFQPATAPQSTDPRVIDAVVSYFKQHTNDIVIAEASGSGFPTRTSFKIAGLHRVAKYHKIELIALEEQPVDRYYLPKANVMKECLIPKIFSEVVKGSAFYVSLPKMKTNMYTDVTLGFKNGMGIIPLNLRQRNHNSNLEKKLVDLLFLLKPDLTVIDGIVGAEGHCPALVYPTESLALVSGTNVVEADRVATQMMGLDPGKVKLIRIATEMGFGNENTEIIGEPKQLNFMKADPSMMNEEFNKNYPEAKILIGQQKPHSQTITDTKAVTNEVMRKMELDCRGGCLVTSKMGFDLLRGEGVGSYPVTLIIGNGVTINGEGGYYFNRDGKVFTKKEIAAIPSPKIAVGNCTKKLKDSVDIHIEGCLYHAGKVHLALHKVSKTKCGMTSRKNKHLIPFALGVLGMRIARRKQIRKGNYVDIELDKITKPTRWDNEATMDSHAEFVQWPFPDMSSRTKRKLLKDEIKSLQILFKL